MKHNKRFLLVALALVLVSLLAVGIALAEDKPITGITLEVDGTPTLVMKKGETLTLPVKYTVTPADYSGDYFTWDIDGDWDSWTTGAGTASFTVSEPGTLKIKLRVKNSDGKYTGIESNEIVFTTTPNPVTGVSFSVTTLKTNRNISLRDYVTVAPADAFYGDNDLVWTVSDATLASINQSTGYLRPLSAGKVTVTATEPNSKKSATIEVEIEKPAGITDISFIQGSLMMYVNNSYNLDNYLVIDPDTYSADDLAWTSSDISVAKTTKNGGNVYVVANKVGTAVITGTDKESGKSASITVTVKDGTIQKLTFSPKEYTLPLGTSGLDLNDYLTVDPDDYHGDSLKWTSSDVSIATVSNGVITTKKAGTVTFTVASKKNPTVADTFTLTVVETPVTAVAFKQANYTLYVDEGLPIVEDLITLTPVDASTPKGITFSSSDRDIVTFDTGDPDDNYELGYIQMSPKYYARAKKEGTATVTVTVRNHDDSLVTGTCTITVKSLKPTSFAFPQAAYTIKKNVQPGLDLGRRLTVKPDDRDWAEVFYDDPDSLIWDSSDYAVATVDGSGFVTAVDAGTATITCTYAYDATITASTTVTVETIPVATLTFPTTKKLEIGGENTKDTTLYLKVGPKNAEIKEVYFGTSDEAIVSVSEGSYYYEDDYGIERGSGSSTPTYVVYLYPKKVGTATITAYVDDGKEVHKAECVVTVTYRENAGLAIVEAYGDDVAVSKLTLPLFKEKKLNQKVKRLYAVNTQNFATYEGAGLKWSSSDTKIATVNRNGYVTVKKDGKVTITVEAPDGRKASCKVTVVKNLIKKITGQKTITMRVCDELCDIKAYLTFTGSAKAFGTDTSKLFNFKFKYSSSNEDVVSVDENGSLVANKVGSANITVTAQDGSKKKFTIKVNVIAAVQ